MRGKKWNKKLIGGYLWELYSFLPFFFFSFFFKGWVCVPRGAAWSLTGFRWASIKMYIGTRNIQYFLNYLFDIQVLWALPWKTVTFHSTPDTSGQCPVWWNLLIEPGQSTIGHGATGFPQVTVDGNRNAEDEGLVWKTGTQWPRSLHAPWGISFMELRTQDEP